MMSVICRWWSELVARCDGRRWWRRGDLVVVVVVEVMVVTCIVEAVVVEVECNRRLW